MRTKGLVYTSSMNLPLGIADFARIRDEGYYYLDKTPFIPLLEDPSKGRTYSCLLRPRRFGKSTLVSMLRSYYDIAAAPDFERLFRGLYIYDHPTKQKNRYLVLHLEFTGLSAINGIDGVRADFFGRVQERLDQFFQYYEPLIPQQAQRWREGGSKSDQPAMLISAWLNLLLNCPYKVYLLVDEYDSFATDIVASGNEKLYHDLVESAGLVREFYKVLKEACGLGLIHRALITGALPVMLYDMASGFNIATYISGDRDLNALCGLTEPEVAKLYDQVLGDRALPRTRAEVLADLRRYYNGYCFNKRAKERLYNPEMVFYFLRKLSTEGEYPASLLPPNTHMVYSKLRSLVFPGGVPRPGPMEHLRSLFATGIMEATIYEAFPLRDAHSPDYFASYLYYQGLLTIAGVEQDTLQLRVPNAVIKGQHGEALAELLSRAMETELGRDEMLQALKAMAQQGTMVPFLRLLYQRVLGKLSQRDLIKMDEKSVKLLLVGYASLSPLFLTYSEHEVSGGYADVVLLKNPGYASATYSYLLELKYVRLTDRGPDPKGPRRRRSAEELRKAVEEKMNEAEAQLLRYQHDARLQEHAGPDGLISMALVFQGFEEIYFRAPGAPTVAISDCLEEEEG